MGFLLGILYLVAGLLVCSGTFWQHIILHGWGYAPMEEWYIILPWLVGGALIFWGLVRGIITELGR